MNNDGLLEFDGTSWRLMRMPNRSVLIEHGVGIPLKEEVHQVVQAFSPRKPGEFARVHEFI